MKIEELQRHAELLAKLLKEPEHGLYTWNLAVAKSWRALAEAWNHPESVPSGTPEAASSTESSTQQKGSDGQAEGTNQP